MTPEGTATLARRPNDVEKLADNGNRRLLYLGIHLLIDLIAKIDELSDFLSFIPDRKSVV